MRRAQQRHAARQPKALLGAMASAASAVRHKRVLVVCHRLCLSDASLALLRLAAVLRKLGARVEALALQGGPLAAHYADAAIPLRVADPRALAWQRYRNETAEATAGGDGEAGAWEGMERRQGAQAAGCSNASDSSGGGGNVLYREGALPWVRPDAYDVIIAGGLLLETEQAGYWLRTQDVAFGLPFRRRVVWWVLEEPSVLLQQAQGLGQGQGQQAGTDPHVVLELMVAHVSRVVLASQALEARWRQALEGCSLAFLMPNGSAAARTAAVYPLAGMGRAAQPAAAAVAGSGGHAASDAAAVSNAGAHGQQQQQQHYQHPWGAAQRRPELRSGLGLGPDAYVLLFAGRPTLDGGLRDVLRAADDACANVTAAAASGPEAGSAALWGRCTHLVVAIRQSDGDGLQEALGQLRALPRSHVHLVPLAGPMRQQRRALQGLYATADALVTSDSCESSARGTSSTAVVLEALAHGLPVLARDCGSGASDLLQHGVDALLHHASSGSSGSAEGQQQLAEHINRLNHRPHAGPGAAVVLHARARMASAARAAFASRFAPQQQLAAWADVLGAAMQGGRQADAERQQALASALADSGMQPQHLPAHLQPGSSRAPDPASECGGAGLPHQGEAAGQAASPAAASGDGQEDPCNGSAGGARGAACSLPAWELPALKGGWRWRRHADAPVASMQAAAFQLRGVLYTVGGFLTSDPPAMWRYDLEADRWSRVGPELPAGLATSHFKPLPHLDRFAYFAGGQVGGVCMGAGAAAYVFDGADDTWHALPELPKPLIGALTFVDGPTNTLHVVMGVKRRGPALAGRHAHLTLRLAGDHLRAAEGAAWQLVAQPPVPQAAMGWHRCALPMNLYRGGQALRAVRVTCGFDKEMAPKDPQRGDYRCGFPAYKAVDHGVAPLPSYALLLRNGGDDNSIGGGSGNRSGGNSAGGAAAAAGGALHDAASVESGEVGGGGGGLLGTFVATPRLSFPSKLHHIENCALAISPDVALLLGGAASASLLSGFVFALHAPSETVAAVGRLPQGPWGVRGGACAYWRGRVWFVSGQAGQAGGACCSGPLLTEVWSSPVPQALLTP